MSVDGLTFLEVLHRKLTETPSIAPEKTWVAGRTDDRGMAVILYRASPGGPVIGRRWNLDALEASFGTDDPSVLAGAVYTSEIAEPEGQLVDGPKDWAQGLVHAPQDVLWAGTLEG